MTCRHRANDTSCSSHLDYTSPYTPSARASLSSVDSTEYTILDVQEYGSYMIVKAKYPSCRSCSYEGVKILVLPKVTMIQALKWRKLDPHFRDPKTRVRETEAPSPVARFPASPEGWQDALAFVRYKQTPVHR